MTRSWSPRLLWHVMAGLVCLSASCLASLPIVDMDANPQDAVILGQIWTSRAWQGVGLHMTSGDLNGDGIDDLVTAFATQRVLVFFGRQPFPSHWDLEASPPDVVIRGHPLLPPDPSCFGGVGFERGNFRASPLAAGDVTGDGIDDLVVGAPCWPDFDHQQGVVVVLPGRPIWPSEIDLDVTDTRPALEGELVDGSLGHLVAVGDMNDDGQLDLIAAAQNAPGAPPLLLPGAGRLYVVFGPIAPDLRTRADQADRILYGPQAGTILTEAAAIGDLDRDQRQELLLGIPKQERSLGVVSILTASDLGESTDLASGEGVVNEIRGVDRYDFFGSALALGDLDCSGYMDLVVTAPKADSLGNARLNAGEAYIFLESAGVGFTEVPEPEPTVTIFGGPTIHTGHGIDDEIGTRLALWDGNGDGFQDIVIAAPQRDGPDEDREDAGEVYIVWNRPDLPAEIDLPLDEHFSLLILGSSKGQRFGYDLQVGDWNGDGSDDLAIGANDPHTFLPRNKKHMGAIYLFTRDLLESSASAHAGPDQTLVVDPGAASCEVETLLDAGASFDRAGNPLSFGWYESSTLMGMGEKTVLALPLGDHCIRLLAQGAGGWDQDSAHIRVVDRTPPIIVRAEASPSVLWPPNHKMWDVKVEIEALDLCAEPSELEIRLVSIESNEPVDGWGDGHTAPDIAGATLGAADFTVQLRAERSGLGEGRTYTLTYRVSDPSGNAVPVAVTVTVPHDLGTPRAK